MVTLLLLLLLVLFVVIWFVKRNSQGRYTRHLPSSLPCRKERPAGVRVVVRHVKLKQRVKTTIGFTNWTNRNNQYINTRPLKGK